MSKKRLKEIDAEMSLLKQKKQGDWVKKYFALKREREDLVSNIGVKKK